MTTTVSHITITFEVDGSGNYRTPCDVLLGVAKALAVTNGSLGTLDARPSGTPGEASRVRRLAGGRCASTPTSVMIRRMSSVDN